jgi:hypothetical protein
LFDGVFDGLLGETVFQLEGGDGKTVDERAEVEGAAGFVCAVGGLAGDGEAVLLV